MAWRIAKAAEHQIGRGVLLTAAAAFISSCTFSVPLNPVFNPPQADNRIPLTIGVYYSPEFRAAEGVELVGLHGESRFIRPLGHASVPTFNSALSALFQQVVSLTSPPPVKENEKGVTAVIEPTIESVSFGPPNRGNGYGPAVWAEITYGIKMYSPGGDLIGSWKVTGMGQATTRAFHELEYLGHATDRAIQEAMTKFVNRFRDVPEVRRWLRESGTPIPGQKKAD